MKKEYQSFLNEEKRLENLYQLLVKNRDTFCTIARMSLICHGQPFCEQWLINATKEIGLPTFEFYDVDKKLQVGYHRDVWLEAYALTF